MIGEDEASTPPREMWYTGGIAMETSIQLRACGLFGNKMGELACEAPTNDAAVPEGEYLSSCGGCLLKAGGALSCTHCRVASPKAAHFRPKQAPTNSINAAECPAGQTVHNIDGQLACAEQRQQERQEQEQQPDKAKNTPENIVAATDAVDDEDPGNDVYDDGDAIVQGDDEDDDTDGSNEVVDTVPGTFTDIPDDPEGGHPDEEAGLHEEL